MVYFLVFFYSDAVTIDTTPAEEADAEADGEDGEVDEIEEVPVEEEIDPTRPRSVTDMKRTSVVQGMRMVCVCVCVCV